MFDATSPLRTPIIQRSYAWKTGEVEEFWGDLAEGRAADRFHFLGLIVIDDNDWVHDGQQRLATTFLLLQVMKRGLDDAVSGLSPHDLASVNAAALQAAIVSALQGQKQVPAQPLQIGTGDQQFLLDPTTGISTTTESQIRLRKAHGVLLAKLTGELDKKANAKERVEHLWDLWSYLGELACVIELKVSAQTASNVFETLNARGVELSVSDLIKSHLLGTVDNASQTQAMTLWEDTARTLKKETALNEFVLHFWGSRYGQVERGDLFQELKKAVGGKSSLALTWLKRYRKDATLYAALRDANDSYWVNYDDDTVGAVKLINALGLTQLRYLLLAVLRDYPKGLNLSASNRRKRQGQLIQWLSAWSLRAVVTGRVGGAPAEAAYIDAATAVREGNATTVASVRQVFEDAGRTVSDAEFRPALLRATLNATATKVMLTAIENRLLGAASALGPKAKLTREHVLPQSWEKKKWPKFTKLQHSEYVERLGNTLLLVGITNNSLKNKSWKEKKQLILAAGAAQTPLTNLALAETDWTMAAIKRHQKRIVDEALPIWPA